MSSLRLDSLRLCWLETFVTIVQEANISEAARELGINQSTATRNMQALERWLGKKLIEIGKIDNPENPEATVGLTTDGSEFYHVALNIIDQLNGARSEVAIRNWMIEDCTKMVSTMNKKLKSLRNPEKFDRFVDTVEMFNSNLDTIRSVTSLEGLKSMHTIFRIYFKRYERDMRKETKPLKKPQRLTGVSDDWFDTQAALRRQT